jgi:hypothetical protein
MSMSNLQNSEFAGSVTFRGNPTNLTLSTVPADTYAQLNIIDAGGNKLGQFLSGLIDVLPDEQTVQFRADNFYATATLCYFTMDALCAGYARFSWATTGLYWDIKSDGIYFQTTKVIDSSNPPYSAGSPPPLPAATQAQFDAVGDYSISSGGLFAAQYSQAMGAPTLPITIRHYSGTVSFKGDANAYFDYVQIGTGAH